MKGPKKTQVMKTSLRSVPEALFLIADLRNKTQLKTYIKTC